MRPKITVETFDTKNSGITARNKIMNTQDKISQQLKDHFKLSEKVATEVVEHTLSNAKYQLERNRSLADSIKAINNLSIDEAVELLDKHYNKLKQKVEAVKTAKNPMQTTSYGQCMSASFRNNCGNHVARHFGYNKFSTDTRRPLNKRFYDPITVEPMEDNKQVTASGKNNAPDGASIVASDMATSAQTKHNMVTTDGSDVVSTSQSPLVGIRHALLAGLQSETFNLVDVELMIESLKAEMEGTNTIPVISNTEVA